MDKPKYNMLTTTRWPHAIDRLRFKNCNMGSAKNMDLVQVQSKKILGTSLTSLDSIYTASWHWDPYTIHHRLSCSWRINGIVTDTGTLVRCLRCGCVGFWVLTMTAIAIGLFLTYYARSRKKWQFFILEMSYL
jgi:hypothetical protein